MDMKQTSIPEWDMSDLYRSISDPKIELDKKDIDSKIRFFTKNYKENSLQENLKLYEEIKEKLSILENYAFLIYSTNTKDENVSKFNQTIKEYIANSETKILWFQIYLINDDKNVNVYENYLKKIRALKPYTLDEDKEIILTKKNQTGLS